jgi:subtilisin family serine protease
LAPRVNRIRHTSRWLNAVSVEATAEQASALEALPFVTRLAPVERYARRPAPLRSATRHPPDPSDVPAGPREGPPAGQAESAIEYGPALDQLVQINVPAVHDMGLHGQDVVIAVFDTGFDNLVHEAFSAVHIVAAYDFVNGDPDVGSGLDRGDGSHGTQVLSVLGGYKTGELVGPAFAASFILAKTEDTGSETPVEEDNWAAAAEWAEALGAEIITTSLGYTVFDSGTGYGPEDLDGRTAVTTLAAQRAAELGVVVLASAGNGGEAPGDPGRNTLVAPADGASVLAVGGVDSSGERVAFSSVGPTADGRIKPDVMARGVGVRTAGTSSVDQYVYSAGTSFACPLAAGVAALVHQAHPDYAPAQVMLALRTTASRSDAPDNRYGWGILDALAAIRADLAAEP